MARKKERMAVRTLKLRQESDEADRTDSAARSKAAAAATLLSQAMQEEQRLDNGLATIKEAIAEQRSAWAAQNLSEQKESTHRAWQPPPGAQGQAAGSADGAARSVLAGRSAFPPGDPRADE
jgi:5'-deoxynucleotidase YfbR-like HD superfamily hydrolase